MAGDSIPIRRGSAQLVNLEVGGFRITDAIFPPGLTLPSHYHEHACCAVVLEGSVDKRFYRASYASPELSVVTMPAQERHQDQFENAGAHMLVVEPVATSEDQLRPLTSVFNQINHFRNGRAAALAWQIAHELQTPDAVSPLAVNGLVLELLAFTQRRHDDGESDSLPPRWLDTVVELLHAQFQKSLQVKEIADTVGVHPVHLSRVFRQHFNMSVGDYVRQLRINWATAQLESSPHTLSTVALKAGFYDQSHFTRVFKRTMGVTPGEYRKSMRRR